MTQTGFTETDLNQKVDALLSWFRKTDANMKDLPIYHKDLSIDAVGFRLWEGNIIGVVITPWFMNAVLFPKDGMPEDRQHVGQRVRMDFPSGEQKVLIANDEGVGFYYSKSLMSPMFCYKSMDFAASEGLEALNGLLTSPEPEGEEIRDASEPEADMPNKGRRALFGLSGKEA